MSVAAPDATTDPAAPPERRTAGQTASTYEPGLPVGEKGPARSSEGEAWLARAHELSSGRPAARRGVLSLLLAEGVEALRQVSDEQAYRLGQIVGVARADGAPALKGLLGPMPPPRASWSHAFASGVLRHWPRALQFVVDDADLRSEWLPALTDVLEDCLTGPEREVRVDAARALGARAARGEVRALGALARAALWPALSDSERAEVVELLFARAVRAMPKLALRRDVQDAVDVAVSLVDVALKVGREDVLDRALARLDPETLPPEVLLAFLTTSQPAAPRLPARADLVSRFERAIRARRRPDADALLRFAR